MRIREVPVSASFTDSLLLHRPGACMPRKKTRRRLPKQYQWLMARFPEVVTAYEELGTTVHKAGPLDGRTRALVKLALSIGARLEGGVHSHARKALEAGAEPEDLLHVAIIALPTIGLPSTVAALSWIRDVVEVEER